MRRFAFFKTFVRFLQRFVLTSSSYYLKLILVLCCIISIHILGCFMGIMVYIIVLV